jgi:hypothetical protein
MRAIVLNAQNFDREPFRRGVFGELQRYGDSDPNQTKDA